VRSLLAKLDVNGVAVVATKNCVVVKVVQVGNPLMYACGNVPMSIGGACVAGRIRKRLRPPLRARGRRDDHQCDKPDDRRKHYRKTTSHLVPFPVPQAASHWR